MAEARKKTTRTGSPRSKNATAARKPRARRSSPPVLKSFNPATGEALPEVRANTPGEVKDAVEQARKVAPEWAALVPQARARMLKEVRHRIYSRLDDIVETVAQECGKPRAEALAHDVMPTVLALQYFERMSPRWLKSDRPGRFAGWALGTSSRVEMRPYGVVACISPWNYPFFLSFMGIIPALMAGNAVLLKPSELTPGVGERLREVLDVLPSGVATVLQGDGEIGGALVDAPVDKITFIGSPATGRKIAAAAARHLTPVVMELGGQDAAIICEDADLDVASSGLLWGAFLNSGQTCAAVERAYVNQSIADKFEDMLVAKAARLRQGPNGDVGALTAQRQLDTVRRHLADAVDKGARVLIGGSDSGRPNDNGSLWHAPTVISGRDEAMTISKEETFGPLLPIVRVSDDAEAVRRANEDGFNLTASVWSADRARARGLAAQLKAGTISINSHADAAGAPWSPWGGVGESGYGRLNGIYGLREFVAPVHVFDSRLPRLKKLWWYPYGESTTKTLRAITELLSAPKLSDKATAFKSMLENAGEAVREKL